MKRAIRVASLVVCLGGVTGAAAQGGGNIGIYADQGWSECNLIEAVNAINTVYVVHDLWTEALSSQFMLVRDWTNATPLSVDFNGNAISGDLYTGITIGYPGCQPLPYLLCSLDFFVAARTPACTVILESVADPAVASGQIEVLTCTPDDLRYATGSILYANVDYDQCYCDWPTEEATWSKIKAMYQ